MINKAQRWWIIELLNGAVQPTPPPVEEFRVINADTQELRIINEETEEKRIT